ncbi:uncharacterized protein LOC141888885 [Acropora palmata]|uniref:uncharacterized protein LOC141888885 n=1 Tax=Acropora palmata TaxID=6131 RepID=UPI003DA0D25A
MAQSNNIIEKKWRKVVYEKHRKRLSETKSRLKTETTLQYNDAEAQQQLRFRRILAEEERQAVIDKQNTRLLQRIIDVMTSKKKTLPPTDVKEANRKISKNEMERRDKSTAKSGQALRLPAV